MYTYERTSCTYVQITASRQVACTTRSVINKLFFHMYLMYTCVYKFSIHCLQLLTNIAEISFTFVYKNKSKLITWKNVIMFWYCQAPTLFTPNYLFQFIYTCPYRIKTDIIRNGRSGCLQASAIYHKKSIKMCSWNSTISMRCNWHFPLNKMCLRS